MYCPQCSGHIASDVELESGFLISSHGKSPLDAFCGPISRWPKAAETPCYIPAHAQPNPFSSSPGEQHKGDLSGPLALLFPYL